MAVRIRRKLVRESVEDAYGRDVPTVWDELPDDMPLLVIIVTIRDTSRSVRTFESGLDSRPVNWEPVPTNDNTVTRQYRVWGWPEDLAAIARWWQCRRTHYVGRVKRDADGQIVPVDADAVRVVTRPGIDVIAGEIVAVPVCYPTESCFVDRPINRPERRTVDRTGQTPA